MTTRKINNLIKMKEVSLKKECYGLKQITDEFSPSAKLSNDNKATKGKRILREKIYG